MAGIDLSCPTNPPLPLPAGGQLGAARGCGDLNAISQFMAFNFDHIPPRRIPQCAPTAPSARCPMPKSHPFVHRLPSRPPPPSGCWSNPLLDLCFFFCASSAAPCSWLLHRPHHDCLLRAAGISVRCKSFLIFTACQTNPPFQLPIPPGQEGNTASEISIGPGCGRDFAQTARQSGAERVAAMRNECPIGTDSVPACVLTPRTTIGVEITRPGAKEA